MFLYQELKCLGQFTMLKREIKCGGIQQIVFGENNLIILEN
jgi:hypothetical protein